jgi:SAM-dependent methyltransferase
MVNILNRIRDAIRNPNGYYARIKLSPADIEKQTYKKFLGGGQEKWESRGKFQLFFLKKMGLAPFHRLLDVGCGPIRAGVHFIDYLNPALYCGVDYNHDFILTAKELVAKDRGLAEKLPELAQLDNFEFSKINGTFDYVMAFSVLNHCDNEKKKLFFRELPRMLKKTAKVYITHATWFEESMLSAGQLRLTNRFIRPEDISPDLDMEKWGWPPEESIYPILELMSS